MSVVDALLGRPRLLLGSALLASGVGVAAWLTMPRQEDPSITERFGMVVTTLPGADAEQVERLVARPLEEELAEVEEVVETRATLRASVAVVEIRLASSVAPDEVDRAWDRVEEALARARREMPAEAVPSLDHDVVRTEALVLAVSGPTDVVELAEAAEAVERRLLAIDDVAHVALTGDPGEQIVIELDEAAARPLGIGPEDIARLVASRNPATPGAAVRVAGQRVEVVSGAEIESVEELARTPVVLRSGAAVPLSAVARVRRAPVEPRTVRARFDGRDAVFVGVVPSEGVDVVELGSRLEEAVRGLRASHPELRIDVLANQPSQVEARLSDLGRSLALGIGVVALVLVLTMGPRLGMVVAAIVPLVTFASLALYRLGGGVLHQMAIAALVVALGLLVDNAIVMAEAIQRRLDDGEPHADAVRGAVRELAVPLASATATTLAAFVPMLLGEGGSGDFTRAIPIVVMTTLTVSYVYAVTVTPLLGRLLKPSARTGPGRVERLARAVARFAIGRPAWALLSVLVVIVLAGSFAGRVDKDFFPPSDRAQLVVSVELPEGTHIEATDEAARRLERALRGRPEVLGVAAVVGTGLPRFYYNLPRLPRAPHLAQLVVSTESPARVGALLDFIRAWGTRALPDARVVPRRLEQGPPVAAPIEVRLDGDDLGDLVRAAEAVQRVLRSDRRTRDVRADHGPGAPVLRYRVDDAAAGRYGLSRADVATALLGRVHGLEVGRFRGDDETVPIVVRGALGEDHGPADLDAVPLRALGASALAPPTPLRRVARATLSFAPAVIHHQNRARVVSVLAEVRDGATYAAVVADLTPALTALELPEGVGWEHGGATESSGEANEALAATAPYGGILLVLILLAQFDSVRRLAIVLVTAPLAVMGIWVGLWALSLPFGFVALLGAIALIGIVVNGAIVLIDRVEHLRAGGMSIAAALEDAVAVRTRPILLTALTTVAGLTPLLFSRSTLWPPMAAAMISGLSVATVLTLVAVPALYRLAFRDPPLETTVR
ncbi:MAG: efflux RND transporter permease subunit [Myxococcales bacterium]|nr:efflux RND transporter permease subunit [Myxococcales bacterium]